MKRILDGKAYNTDTAQHVATASCTYDKREDDEWTCAYDLYRTKGGAFFLVAVDSPVVPPRDSWGAERVVEHVDFTPLSYDGAHQFARGEGSWNVQVDLLVDGIFPSVPEAEDGPDAPE